MKGDFQIWFPVNVGGDPMRDLIIRQLKSDCPNLKLLQKTPLQNINTEKAENRLE